MTQNSLKTQTLVDEGPPIILPFWNFHLEQINHLPRSQNTFNSSRISHLDLFKRTCTPANPRASYPCSPHLSTPFPSSSRSSSFNGSVVRAGESWIDCMQLHALVIRVGSVRARAPRKHTRTRGARGIQCQTRKVPRHRREPGRRNSRSLVKVARQRDDCNCTATRGV